MLDIKPLKLGNNTSKCQEIHKHLKCLIFDNATIERIKSVFNKEMELALNEQPSSLQMENTYIPELPDGSEEGTYLALDLGGTNFRVILMVLANGQIINEVVKHYHIENNLRIGCGDTLFDYLAECVDNFAKINQLDDDVIYPLGFTFSFPMRQHSLDSGCLVTWTKSFNCPSIVGKDVVERLRQSLIKCKRKNIEVLAILNDTTGTLVQGARLDPNTRIGIVLGTGSNGCYMEYADRVKHWETQRHGERNVIIDIEWGAFGDNGVLDFIKTDYDRCVDEGSLLKNSFTFEKYISGKYLGELCRVILRHLHDKGLFLPQIPIDKFPQAWCLGSDVVSKIEQDTIDNSCVGVCGGGGGGDAGGSHSHHHPPNLAAIWNDFGCNDDNQTASHFTSDDLEILRYVCGLISKRAAQLVAINISVILNRMNDGDDDDNDDDDADDSKRNVTVAIDGSVYKHHPRLRHWITEYTGQWAPRKKSKFMLAEDGSGKGAALVAAIAKKLQQREKNF